MNWGAKVVPVGVHLDTSPPPGEGEPVLSPAVADGLYRLREAFSEATRGLL